MERTHTQERYKQKEKSEGEVAEKTEEHSSRRFTELPGKASDRTDHTKGGSYTAEEGCTIAI